MKLLLVIALTVVALCVEEFYPFSHYPMYSNFDGVDYYLHLEDQSGKPVPCAALRSSAPKLKKRFNTRLKKEARRQKKRERELDSATLAELGTATLEAYGDAIRQRDELAKVTELRLIRVDLEFVDGEIRSTPVQIAVVPTRR